MKRLSKHEAQYWSNVTITISQVFFGIAAVTFFAGSIDFGKSVVIILNLIISIVAWFYGWRLIR